jgi:hypothetical protein
MGQTKTNNFSLSYAKESTVPGVLPVTPDWRQLEPNGISTYGTEMTTSARAPISKRRQRRKGKLTDQSSTVEFDHDLTLDPAEDFMGAFAVAKWQGPAPQVVKTATATAFGVTAAGITFKAGNLVHVRGMKAGANNGLFEVNGVPTAASIPVTSVLALDAAANANAVIELAGYRGAAGDLRINAAGNLTSTALNFTTLNLQVGQTIYIGGDLAANQFFRQGDSGTNTGYVRVVGISANLLTLDHHSQPFLTDDGTVDNNAGAGKRIDLLFGRFLRNVDVDNAQYLETSFTFEGAYANLEDNGSTSYEYSIGNFPNEATFNLPETDKATMTFGFVGIDTLDLTPTRKTGAAAALVPVRTDSFGTSTDIARLRLQNLDEFGLATCFKSLSLTIQNNVEPEKCLGTLGSPFINLGNFNVDMEATLLFTDKRVVNAIKANETLALNFALDNDDGAIHVDIPSLTLGGGGREFSANRSITISLTGEAFGDSVFDASLMLSLFPFVPTV